LEASQQKSRLLISNEYTNRMVHKWRSEEMAILVGTNTALYDNPGLTTRLWPGKSPIRLVVDMDLKLPSTLKLFNSEAPTIVFNTKQHNLSEGLLALFPSGRGGDGPGFYQVTEDVSLVHQITNALYQLNIQSVLVEGGAFLLQSFIDEGIWDDAKIITNQNLIIGDGLPAPILKNGLLKKTENIYSDNVRY
jgi:diaminohydroxyphosphoribosylaminopyrimidine deaminase/5-amino-6-(5-phosphoribosylamino)uracil reductase